MSITLSTIAPILFLSTPERRLNSGSRYYRALSVCRRSILVLSVTSNLLHRAAPRCARARLTRYHRHPCVSHYGSGCWPRGQPNKIYEPNTQRRTSVVSNWNRTAQHAQQRWWVGMNLAFNPRTQMVLRDFGPPAPNIMADRAAGRLMLGAGGPIWCPDQGLAP